MFHMRKLSNTRSTPVAFSSKPTKTRWGHERRTSIYPRTDICASRDTTPTTNHTSAFTAQLPKASTKPSHRRGRPSIDKSQVSKPFPILAHDERELFDVIASGNTQTRARGIPKVAEKKVKIDAPESIKSSPQPKSKVSADTASQSWYTLAPAQSPAKRVLQRSTSNATPRTSPSKVDLGRANSAREFRSHLRTESETRRDGVEPAKRHVQKHLITHPDCPWLESSDDPYAHAGYLAQYRPVRSATRGSYESDETAVDDDAPTPIDAKKEGEAPLLVKSIEDTLRPTIRLISKPLPDPPAFNSLSSRCSPSTGSARSDDDDILDQFPKPPSGIPNVFNDCEDFDSLSTPPVFMSCPNHSSSSVATITPTVTPDISPVRPLMLKVVRKPKAATVVHQIPHGSYSCTHLQDSLVTRGGRAYPQASMKGSIHTSIRTAGAAPTLPRKTPSVTPPLNRNRPNGPTTLLELVFGPQPPERIEEYKRECLKRQERYNREGEQRESEEEQKEHDFHPPEHGYREGYGYTRCPDVEEEKQRKQEEMKRQKEIKKQKEMKKQKEVKRRKVVKKQKVVKEQKQVRKEKQEEKQEGMREGKRNWM